MGGGGGLLSESGVKGMKSQTIKIKEFPIFPKGKREVGVGWEQEGVGEKKEILGGKRMRPEDEQMVEREGGPGRQLERDLRKN